MLDIKFVRENPEIVKQNIRNKFQDSKLELVDKVLELDKENREIKQEVEALRAERNKISKQIGALMGFKFFLAQHYIGLSLYNFFQIKEAIISAVYCIQNYSGIILIQQSQCKT